MYFLRLRNKHKPKLKYDILYDDDTWFSVLIILLSSTFNQNDKCLIVEICILVLAFLPLTSPEKSLMWTNLQASSVLFLFLEAKRNNKIWISAVAAAHNHTKNTPRCWKFITTFLFVSFWNHNNFSFSKKRTMNARQKNYDVKYLTTPQ